MFDHVGVAASNFDKSKAFYTAALAPLGYAVVMEFGGEAAGLGDAGAGGRADFWVAKGKAGSTTHLAFAAKDRATVDAFHKAALAAGGKDNGKPGIRAQYHPNYYGAFVFDPDGNNVEAVCHKPG